MSEMRLIDANALAKWLDKEHYIDRPAGKCDERQNRVLGIAISALKNPQIAPTIDAVPVVHAFWRPAFDQDYSVWRCTKCGYAINTSDHVAPGLRYCPNCGAKMEGGSE